MAKPFTGEEFAQALSSGTLKESVVLAGMAKKSDDDPQVILFSPGMSCLHWIPIPVKMIDKVDHLGQVPCKDHTHHSVRITLKETTDPEGKVLAALLGDCAGRMRIRSSFATNKVGCYNSLNPDSSTACQTQAQGYGYSVGSLEPDADCERQYGPQYVGCFGH